MSNEQASNTITDRFDYLKSLEKGWIDGEYGDKIDPKHLQVAKEITSKLEENPITMPDGTINNPGIFPVEDGGVTLEWIVENNENKQHPISILGVVIGDTVNIVDNPDDFDSDTLIVFCSLINGATAIDYFDNNDTDNAMSRIREAIEQAC